MTFDFVAATTVRGVSGWRDSSGLAQVWRVRRGLCRLLFSPRPLLCLGRQVLLQILGLAEEVWQKQEDKTLKHFTSETTFPSSSFAFSCFLGTLCIECCNCRYFAIMQSDALFILGNFRGNHSFTLLVCPYEPHLGMVEYYCETGKGWKMKSQRDTLNFASSSELYTSIQPVISLAWLHTLPDLLKQ